MVAESLKYETDVCTQSNQNSQLDACTSEQESAQYSRTTQEGASLDWRISNMMAVNVDVGIFLRVPPSQVRG